MTPRRLLCLPALLLVFAAGCSRAPVQYAAAGLERYKPSGAEFSVMQYNLMRFQHDDRDGDGQPGEFKPQAEIDAECGLIADVAPSVLAVEEIGDARAMKILRAELEKRGQRYVDVEHLIRPDSHTHMAVLSKFPIVARQSITNETYTIGETNLPVQRGFISVDIQVSPSYRFRLMVAHLKSKRYSPLGQTEMRRNEGRLLNKNVRRYLRDAPGLNLLVVGDLNDNSDSAAVKEAIGRPPDLVDLRPYDLYGDVWTHYFVPEETYARIDYMLASRGMTSELVRAKSHIVRDGRTYAASDHRPLVAVFSASETAAGP